MKLFIVIHVLTLLFGFSASKLFIFRYKELIKYYKLDEDKWESFVVENTNIEDQQSLCEELQNSPIFTDESSVNDGYYFRKVKYTKSEPMVQQITVLVGFNKKIITTLLCEYDGSTVYVAKHSNCEYFLLFEQQYTYIPSLTAVITKPIKFEKFPKKCTKKFHILLKKYNSPERYNEWSNKNFVLQDEIKIFQLCMTLLLHVTKGNLSKIKIQLTVSGHVSNQRIKDEVHVDKIHDMKVAQEMGLIAEENENMAEEDDDDSEIEYEVPTIKCHTIKMSSYVQHESQITFFFTSHPEPSFTNNVIFFYYKYCNERNVLLYSYTQAYAAMLNV